MSLKAIHAFVIFLSILLLFFFGFWAISNAKNSNDSHYWLLGILACIAGILLVLYWIWFIMKILRKSI